MNELDEYKIGYAYLLEMQQISHARDNLKLELNIFQDGLHSIDLTRNKANSRVNTDERLLNLIYQKEEKIAVYLECCVIIARFERLMFEYGGLDVAYMIECIFKTNSKPKAINLFASRYQVSKSLANDSFKLLCLTITRCEEINPNTPPVLKDIIKKVKEKLESE